MTSRTDFNESWLNEMPMGIGRMSNDMFKTIVHSINDYQSHGVKPSSLSGGYKKIFGQQVAFYWHVNANDDIDIAMELSVTPQALVVNGVGKSPTSEVYASDLYEIVLKDQHKSIRLMSDEILSDQGLSLWKRLLSNPGHTVSVYDRENPNGLVKLNSVAELENYFQFRNPDFRRYQYVLSEMGEKLAETNSYFNTHRMRMLSGLGTED